MDFPDELIAEILIRLPVKSLLRFKSVSRSWRSLISSRRFVTKHLMMMKLSDFTHQRILLNCHGHLKQCSVSSLIHDPIVEPLDWDYSPNPFRNSVWVVGSCHGMVCLTVDRNRHLVLWNPSLKIFRQLPDFGVSFGSYFAYGLGFDSSTDDYKLVGFYKDGGNCIVVKVYSLKSNEWRRMRDYKGHSLMADPAVFVNGKLHWNTIVDPTSGGWDIVSVDLETEEYGTFGMPDYVKSGSYSALGVYGGEKLCVFCCHLTCAEVWFMNGEGSWTKMVSIPYFDEHLRYKYNRLLYVMEKGEIVLLQSSSDIVIFDSRDSSSIRYPVIRNNRHFVAASSYMETLVSPFYDDK
ncbi:hypothetical protein M569_05385 [Genlisea aurea]|uniref:F-box domain-containing protein n=1 Tax=Genlisea aurea TaxID=192259 RepID=S8EA88_9LAMI|nr:hypothetical protein M569_05385 [Genlisea aurea]